jgi:hypothetical protein
MSTPKSLEFGMNPKNCFHCVRETRVHKDEIVILLMNQVTNKTKGDT